MSGRGRGVAGSTVRRPVARVLAVVVLLLFGSLSGSAASGSAASGPLTVPAVEGTAGSGWKAAWGTALVRPPDTSTISLGHQTVRMTVRVTLGGSELRIRLSNRYGLTSVTFGSVYLGRAAGGGAVRQGSNRRLRFDGGAAVTVPPGGQVRSDPLAYRTDWGEELVVSAYLAAGGGGPVSWHPDARSTTYLAAGDHAAEHSAAGYSQANFSWFFLDAVQVASSAPATVVAFGDSITDGAASTLDANRRYPDQLAARLREAGIERGVVNAGIGGNRLLSEGVVAGPSGLARFERDALGVAGVRHVIVQEGINDIGLNPLTPPGELIAGYRELIRRAHQQGARIYGGTLLPYRGATYYTERGEQTRVAVNKWIRTSGEFDGVVDFDAALRDPQQPERLRPAYDSGDHLHPNDAGYQAMADAVKLRWFSGTGSTAAPPQAA